MYLCQIYVSLKFWTSGFAGVIFGYTVQFEMIQFNAITAQGTVYNEVLEFTATGTGSGWQSD